MIPRIQMVKTLPQYVLQVTFDDGLTKNYDMQEDISTLPRYGDLVGIHGLFEKVQLDQSRTCVFWNDYIDLPSDILYEYGILVP